MKNYPKVSFFDRILCIQIWEIIMERNIIGDLLILKQMNININATINMYKNDHIKMYKINST